jgi:hypothetical protein
MRAFKLVAHVWDTEHRTTSEKKANESYATTRVTLDTQVLQQLASTASAVLVARH